ncbi:putative radial spoke protein 3 [Trypanosoma conorhini]|uniref:Putative radial spoke protein 3 n=1 Tax=Trypanosoma conorhini TaxID=83891 RepID=A0A422PYC0_9TRYP|nr:putative radial spoke protein 3 [Trypanosoma conorhini]RNF22477.1 putative radial spoke protein 3 [Trypanosoma conorhini]
MLTFYKDPYCKLPVFVMGESARRCILWIGGQSESFLTFGYFPELVNMLEGEWQFAQMELASSRVGYGAQDHVHDAEDVDDLLDILVKEYDMEEVALFGTSTGAQVVFELLENGRNVEFITRVILYGVVCDPEVPLFTPEGEAERKEFVAKLIAEGRHEDSRAMVNQYDIPVTPARLASGGYPTLQEAVWCPCFRNDTETLRKTLGLIKVPLLLMLAHHAQYKPAAEEVDRVMELVKEHTGCTHVTVSYFNDTCDERRRVLKAAEAEHVEAIVQFIFQEEEKRNKQLEQQKIKAVEDEKKRKSVLQASAFAQNVIKSTAA